MTAPTTKPAHLFKPFSWFSWTDRTPTPGIIPVPSHRVLSTASTIRDLTNGIELVLEMIERDMIDGHEEEDAPPPLLSNGHRDTLMRMAITAAKIAAREAETLTDWVIETGERQAKGGTR